MEGGGRREGPPPTLGLFSKVIFKIKMKFRQEWYLGADFRGSTTRIQKFFFLLYDKCKRWCGQSAFWLFVWFLLWVCKLGVLNNLPTWHYSEMTSIGLCSAPCVRMLILSCSFMALQHAWSFTLYLSPANQRQGNRYCLNDHLFIGTPRQGQDSRFVGTGSHKLVFLWGEEVENQFSSFTHS